MRAPTVFTIAAVVLAWTFVALGQPILATVTLFFCLFGLAGWFIASPSQAFGAMLALAACSPPGAAFALGLTDGFLGGVELVQAEQLSDEGLLSVPYSVGLRVFTGPNPEVI